MLVFIFQVFRVDYLFLANGEELAPVRADLSFPLLETLKPIVMLFINSLADL
jgi:hypothetical protein